MKSKGTLKYKSGIQYFVLIEGVYNKKRTQLQSVPIPFNLIENLDGKIVDVDYSNTGGQVAVNSIACEGKTYQKVDKPTLQVRERSDRGKFHSNKPHNYTGGNMNFTNNVFSKTPYNFVSLNENILLQSIFSDGREDEKQDERSDKRPGLKPDCTNNQYHKGKYTGSIKISIENETPLFIGAFKQASKHQEGFSEIEPYKINGNPAIPGSSIRGMLYSLVEVFGYGPMVNLMDKPVYFRSTMKDFQSETKLRFGIISYEDSSYKIYDFNNLVEKLNSREYNRELQLIDDTNYLGISSGKIMGKVHAFGIAKNRLDFNSCKVYDSPLIKKIIDDYESDANRADQVNNRMDILKNAKGHKITGINNVGCPIWFGLNENEVTSIGHAKYHRIPAQSRTIDLLPSDHREAFEVRQSVNNKQSYDLSLAERIFGTSEFRSTKVRIEDAKSKNAKLGELRLLKSLQSPKVKSANLYLEAPNGKPDWQEGVDGQKLRGFKMYYNKSVGYVWYDSIVQRVDFEDEKKYKTKLQQQQKLQSLISPINPNAKFETSIHFNDLTNYELGALLFSLQLPEDLRHSLGMGKPYGLGRVKIKIEELKCFDIEKRYGLGSESGGNVSSGENIKLLIADFEKFILHEIGESNESSLWDVDRLKNAYGLMKVGNDSGEDVKSEYMQLDSFKQKKPIIEDPENLASYKITGERNDFLKK